MIYTSDMEIIVNNLATVLDEDTQTIKNDFERFSACIDEVMEKFKLSDEIATNLVVSSWTFGEGLDTEKFIELLLDILREK